MGSGSVGELFALFFGWQDNFLFNKIMYIFLLFIYLFPLF